MKVTRFAPAVVAALAIALTLLKCETDLGQAVLYLFGFAWTVTLPGMLVYRATRGRPNLMLSDVGLGSALGLGIQLLVWFVLTGSSMPWLMSWYPLAFVAGFAISPLRQKVFSFAKYEETLSSTSAWILTACVSLATSFQPMWFEMTLPPHATSWYQDMLWVLGGISELMRTVTPLSVQTAQLPFAYHWFVQAHMAGLAQATGLSPIVILARFWIIPLFLCLIAVSFALMHKLTGKHWPGAVAALVIVTGVSLRLARWVNPAGLDAMIYYSPSHFYSLPVLAFAIHEMGAVFTGAVRKWGWIPLIFTIIVGAGAKSSILPLILGGAGLAWIIVMTTKSGKPAILRASFAMCLPVLGLGLAVPLAAEGGGGSHLQLFSTIAVDSVFKDYFGNRSWKELSDPVIPHLGSAKGLIMLGFALAGYVVAGIWLAFSASLLKRRNTSAWLLVGVITAGFLGTMMISHPGQSQLYFLREAVIAIAFLGVWGVASTVDRAADLGVRQAARWAGFGAAIGIISAQVIRFSTSSAIPQPLFRSVVIYYAALGIIALVLATVRWRLAGQAGFDLAVASGLLAATITGHLFPKLANATSISPPFLASLLLTGLALALAITIGILGSRKMLLIGTIVSTVAVATLGIFGGYQYRSDSDPGKFTVSTQQYLATEWLAQHAGSFDTAATNVHCKSAEAKTFCDSRAYWVSGFSGVRFLIESWGYTVQSSEAHGKDNKPMMAQPYHDRELFELNEAVFYRPTAENVARIRDEYHVKWLFVDSAMREVTPTGAATPVSADIAKFATEVFRSGSVIIYQL